MSKCFTSIYENHFEPQFWTDMYLSDYLIKMVNRNTLKSPPEFFIKETMKISMGRRAQVSNAIVIEMIAVKTVLNSVSYGFRYRLTYSVENKIVTYFAVV